MKLTIAFKKFELKYYLLLFLPQKSTFRVKTWSKRHKIQNITPLKNPFAEKERRPWPIFCMDMGGVCINLMEKQTKPKYHGMECTIVFYINLINQNPHTNGFLVCKYLLSNQKAYLLHIKLTSAGWYFLDELFCPITTIPHDEITNSIKRQNYELCLHQAASGPCTTVETSGGLDKMTLIKADCCSEVGMMNQPTAAMVMTSAEIGHHYYSPSDFPPPIGDDE